MNFTIPATASEKFKKYFPNPHNVIIALHAKSLQHALETTDIALSNGAEWIAMVNHYLDPETAIDYANTLKEKYPYHKVLLNILWANPINVFLKLQWTHLDGVWSDNALIPWVDVPASVNYNDIKNIQAKIWRNGLHFGGINFKWWVQTPEENLWYAISQAKKYIDVVTTSGKWTWYSADPEKVAFLRSITKDFPLSIASWVTADNINDYIRNLDLSIVMTWVSTSYDKDNIDETRLQALIKKVEKYNNRELRRNYEARVLEKYSVDNFPALQQKFKEQWVINITSWSENELEKKLSNLYHSPFILDGVEYASVEAFRMSIKYPLENQKHFDIRNMYGLEAKKAWRDVRFIKNLQYNWHNIIVWSQLHHFLLKRAIKAKLDAHLEIAQLLKESWNLPIEHIPFYKDWVCIYPDSKTIPAEIFAWIITDLRTELQQA